MKNLIYIIPVILFVLFVLFPSDSRAVGTVTVDATSSAGHYTQISVVSTTITISPSANLIAIMTSNASSTPIPVTSVTVNSTPATKYAAVSASSSDEIWILANPPTGAVNVSTTFSKINNGSVSVMSLIGANTVNPVVTSSSVSTTTTTGVLTVNLAAADGNDMLVDAYGWFSVTVKTATPTAGQISLNDDNAALGGGQSYKSVPDGVATTSQWTISAAQTVARSSLVSLLIRPATTTVSVRKEPMIIVPN